MNNDLLTFSAPAAQLKDANTLLRRLKRSTIRPGSRLARIDVRADQILLIACDEENSEPIQLTVRVPRLPDEPGAVGGIGALVVDRHDLSDILVQADKTSPVHFRHYFRKPVDGKQVHRLEVEYRSKGFDCTSTLVVHPNEDAYPVLTLGQSRPIPLTTGHLHTVRTAAQFSSHDPTRSVLNGAWLDPDGTLVATDGRRMFYTAARALHNPDDGAAGVLIPNRVIDILAHKSLHSGTLARHDGHAVSFTFPKVEIAFRVPSGQYPNWKQVIPSATARTGTIAFTPDIAARITHWLRSKRDQHLRIEEANGNTVRLVRYPAKETAHTSANEEAIIAPCAIIGTPPQRIHLNPNFLIPAFEAGLHAIDLIDATTPMVATDGTTRCIIMPVRATATEPATADAE